MRIILRTLFVLTLIALCAVAYLAAYYYWPVKEIPSGVQADRLEVYKAARRLNLYAADELLASYQVAFGFNPLGDKQCQGDGRTPEGKYVIDYHNAQSSCYKSLHISYPDANDRREATARGCSPGGDIMIHGMVNGKGWIGRFHRHGDWTHGCIAMTNAEMDQLWGTVPDGTPIEIFP